MKPKFDINALSTPYIIVDEARLIRNLEILKNIINETGCKILLAQKAFSMFSLYPRIGEYLHGTTASGLYEAKLGYEEMGGETHIYSPAYNEDEFTEITNICDYVVFNSFSQWELFGSRALEAGCSCGLRINPECSTQECTIYDPCAPFSRLGIPISEFKGRLPKGGLHPGITGLHFHTLCEQNSDALIKTLDAVEEKFGGYLPHLKWINFGGGHHITRDDYDTKGLISAILRIKEKYGLTVYLEPGEAVVLNAGYLVSSVREVLDYGSPIAILDTSAACHMPDVLEMPYRPPVIGGDIPGQKAYTYRLSGPTCLAGDIIGDYSFDNPLATGDKVVFGDMAHYTMVKSNTFNGMKLPSIAVAEPDGKVRLIKSFGYEDFKSRLS
ncbi:MAG: carboxynorspermidine decarboxylase [Oscillospiraceae bacterium]|nr:carboxynorspermidine decarboxylase [Oscillospiraceae bacterium]